MAAPRRRFWAEVDDHLRAGHRVFLALVAQATRHSPGTPGARLLLAENGERRGTVGGGVMEHAILRRGEETLARGGWEAPRVETLEHRRGADSPSGMICAGEQSNLYLVCRPAEEGPAIARLRRYLETGESGLLRITPEGLEVLDEAPRPDRPPHRLEPTAEGFLYEEELLERRRLALFGGGHCALALARLVDGLGYDVFAFEGPRKTPEAGLAAHVRSLEVVPSFRDAAARVAYPELTPAVVMTSDFPGDVEALAGALPRPFPFLGVMGSPAKLAAIRTRLLEQGFTAHDLERLTAPVGLPIGSRTPAEIAVSIAAQLLALRAAETETGKETS
jgi:xanthine dehydrogenase accessory factor